MPEASGSYNTREEIKHRQKNRSLMLQLAEFMLQEQLITPAERLKISKYMIEGEPS